jgi:hypothetical protein
MKAKNEGLLLLLGIAVIAALALVFQSVETGSQPPLAASTSPPAYPGPATDSPLITPQDTTLSSTAIGDWTATAPTAQPTARPAEEGQTIQAAAGQLSLTLRPGWYAYLAGTTYLTNYDQDQVQDVTTLPQGGIKIVLDLGTLNEGQNFDDWLVNWIDLSTAPPPDTNLPRLSVTEPEPYELGSYAGVAYFIEDIPRIMQIVLPASDGRIVMIGLTSAETTDNRDALAMLSTLQILPKP